MLQLGLQLSIAGEGSGDANFGSAMATGVVQLLRDEMYRACEAYLNGIIDDVAYTLKLARLDEGKLHEL